MGDVGSMVQGGLGFIGGRQQLEAQQEDFVSGQQFSAQQAALNRQFQQGQQSQAEAFMADMSNTAMQRRVADLKAAGLNPLLAIGQGGASAPTIGGQPGSMGSSPGVPALPNAFAAGTAAYNSAQMAQAQTKLANAQAAKTTSETPTPDFAPKVDPDTGELVVKPGGHELGDANLGKIMADTGVSKETALQVKANVDLIGAQFANQISQAGLNGIKTALEGQSLDIIQATKAAVIKEGLAAGAVAGNMERLMSDKFWGPIITTLQQLSGPMHSAASVFKALTP